MRKKFNLTNEQKEKLTSLDNSCCDLYEILDYFESIRPKSYIRLLKHVAKKYGVDTYDNDIDWEGAENNGCINEIILDVKIEILERCGIDLLS